MFGMQELQQEKDDKPPSFFYPAHQDQTSLATKIMECPVSIQTLSQKNIQAQIILYEQWIAAQISGKTYIFETELTISFEAIPDQKEIKFEDRQRELEMRMIFTNKKEFEMFYREIKRSLFQLDFDLKYETIGIIGSGKTGQVFKVKNNSSGVVYAAKVCSNFSSAIQRQIQILKILQHPNLIFFHEMFLCNCQVYLILDYEDGGNLLDKINQKDFLTMKEKIKFLMDMLNAFEFLRIKGIIHRDLKPENILYSKKENCYKIADFSLAITENEPTTKIVGTPGYLAPESFDSDQEHPYSHYSDIYSLGLIYFEVQFLILYRATKKTYINGESVEMIIRKNKKPKSLKKAKYSKEQISELEYEILRMMIRTEPSNRQLSVEILQSSELRKLVKDFSLDMKTSGSSSTSSNNKQNQRKNSLNSDLETPIEEDNLIESMKKYLRIRSAV